MNRKTVIIDEMIEGYDYYRLVAATVLRLMTLTEVEYGIAYIAQPNRIPIIIHTN